MSADAPSSAVHDLLIRSRSLATDDAVLRALPRMEIEWRTAALHVLLKRDRASAFARLIAQFDDLDEDWRNRLAQHAARLSPGIRLCIESKEDATRLAAVALMRRARSSQLAYLLVDALCCGCPSTAEQAAVGILHLTSDSTQSSAEDRAQLIAALIRAAAGWNAHRRDEVLMACAMSADQLLEPLSQLAADSRKPVSRALKRFVRETREPKAAALVLRALTCESLADAASENFASVTDHEYVQSLLDESQELTDAQLRSTCSRVRRIAWLDDLRLIESLGQRRLNAAIRLVRATGVSPARKTQFVRSIHLDAFPTAAQAAIDMLAEQNSDEARQLLRTFAIRRGSQAAKLARQALQPTLTRSITLPPAAIRPATAADKLIRDFWQDSDALAPADRGKIACALNELGPGFARFLQHNLAKGAIVDQLRAIGIIAEANLLDRFELEVQRSARHPDPLLRAAAIEHLSQLDGPATRRILRDALHDPDHRVHASAIEVVERLKLREFVPLLTPALSSPNNRVRANAIKALLRFGENNAARHARAMLRSDAAGDRLSGAWLVEALPLPDLVDQLRPLAEADPDVRVRRRAEAALRKFTAQAPGSTRQLEEEMTPCG